MTNLDRPKVLTADRKIFSKKVLTKQIKYDIIKVQKTKENKKMKNLICGIVVTVLTLIALGIGGDIENHYTVNAKVVSVNSYEIIFEDENGEWWSWEEENPTAQIGAECKLKMYINGTDRNIYDDEIVKISWK